ncbi:MAG: sporulation protein [Ruminococcus sp.]|nr:sporulation protein [Ruminococcus sp.]
MPMNRKVRAAAVAAGLVLSVTGTAPDIKAVETTVPAGTTSTSAETTVPEEQATTAAPDETGEAPEEEKDWYKADFGDYDGSLSLISYEASPESGGGAKKKSKDPTPVELNVTGGYVGDIPWLESEPVIESSPGRFAIVTYGWGHGVGLSQNGANYFATYAGWTYQDILFHYYPGAYLMNTGLAEEEQITINGVTGDVLSMLSQVVYNEVGSSMNYEAMKAQAVAAYTYCKYNGNDGNDLRCKPNPPQVVVDAVSEVLGQAMYYDGDYALTMFYASSGGITANCYEVFWADLPYLRSVSSDYDAAFDPHYGTVTYVDDFQLRNMIQSAYGIKLSDDPFNWIKPEYSADTGYVTYVNIDDQLTVKGYDFKLAMNLKSSKFNLYYTPRPEGEAIPDGSSQIIVVDPDYNYTPGISYPNDYPTDIGSVPEPTDPPVEDQTDPWYEDPTEPPVEDVTEPWQDPATEPPVVSDDSAADGE